MLVAMKKVELTFLKQDRDKMLRSLQRGAHVMIVETEDTKSETDQSLSLQTQQSESMLRLLNAYSKKPSFFQEKPRTSYERFLEKNKQGRDLVKELEAVSLKISELENKISTLENQNQTLSPWLGIGGPTDRLRDTKYVTVVTGFLQPQNREPIENLLIENGQDIQILQTVPEGIACVIYLYRGDAERLKKEIVDLGFNEVKVPQTERDPLEIVRENHKQIEGYREEIQKLKESLHDYGKKRDELELLIQQEISQKERIEAPLLETVQTVTLTGWVRSDRVREFKKDVRSASDIYDLRFVEPEEGEVPPTVTKNPFILAQFETITDSFSLPKAGSVDPAPVAGPWYWLIYGMMMGDAGYGLVMVVLLYLFRRIKKPEGDFGRLVNVLYYSGYATILWGILFGSYFGETFYPILFNPLEAPLYMLIFSLIIGVLQVFSGMAIKIYMDYKEGHLIDGIFDQFSWMVLITGAGFLFLEPLRTVGTYMAIAGALVILFTAGRKKPTIIGKITGGLLGLYDITSYVSDILSYSRILALGLATSVVGMVMNMLAGMVTFNIIGYIFAAFIFILGHGFNIVLSMLSAYVHDSRLQYIEFFNKFYEGGGLAFKPIQIDQRYIDITGVNTSQGSNAVEGDLQ